MFSTRRGVFAAIMLMVIGIFFTSCEPPPEPVAEKEKISLGISRSFLSIPIYLAKELGFFASEGLDITIHEYGSGKLATDAMLRGEVNISTVADMPIVFNSFKEQDFCVFSTFTSSYSFVKIVGRKDKGIRTAKELKGKKIGTNRGTSSHFYLGAFLTYNHLSLEDIEIVHKKTGQLPDALISGEVDAISIWPPHTQKALITLGDNVIILESPEIYRTTFSLAAKTGLVHNRRPALEKILRALDKSALYMLSDREKAVNALVEIFNVEKEVLNTVFDEYHFGIFLDQALLVGLDDIARWAKENRFVDRKKIPNYLDHLCTEALDAVKPNAVTIIR
jgi:NitT/TauT family transport system substrate-binding protein